MYPINAAAVIIEERMYMTGAIYVPIYNAETSSCFRFTTKMFDKS